MDTKNKNNNTKDDNFLNLWMKEIIIVKMVYINTKDSIIKN